MVTALPLCLLLIAISAASSHSVSSDSEAIVLSENPILERRILKKHKPLKILPLLKKHKKLGGWLSGYGKTQYAEVPVYQETFVRPYYKFHRYQGIEIKPVHGVSSETVSAPESIIGSHTITHSSDYAPSFAHDYAYSASLPSSSFYSQAINDKPSFSSVSSSFLSAPEFSSTPSSLTAPELSIHSHSHSLPAPEFSSHHHSLPAPEISQSISLSPPLVLTPIQTPPKQIFSFISASAPSAPVLPSIPLPLPPAPLSPVFSSVSIPKLAPSPNFVQIPPLPQPAAPIFTHVSAPLPSLPAPAPTPVFSPIPIKIPVPILPPISSISLIPSPVPSAPSISFPEPSPTPLPTLPSPSPVLSISATPEPEFLYPPSNTPIPSYIKDISLPENPVTDPTPTKVVTPHYEEVTPTIADDGSKTLGHIFGGIKAENGLFQKLKGWKAEKANAALSHFQNFKQKPVAVPHPTIAASTTASPQLPFHPTLQFPVPLRPFPLTPDFRPPPVFLPQTSSFVSPVKYESFPPNNVESPPLFNSYGVPIPHNSYTFSHGPHDRLSPDASEEEPSILPAPSAFGDQTKEQNEKNVNFIQTQVQPENHSQQSQIRQEFQPQFQPQELIPQDQPIYVPEDNKSLKEETKGTEEGQVDANLQQKEPVFQPEEPEEPNFQNQHNHKE